MEGAARDASWRKLLKAGAQPLPHSMAIEIVVVSLGEDHNRAYSRFFTCRGNCTCSGDRHRSRRRRDRRHSTSRLTTRWSASCQSGPIIGALDFRLVLGADAKDLGGHRSKSP